VRATTNPEHGAAAPAGDLQVVLADELAAALDTKNAAPVFAILRGLARRGRTMIAMTQDAGLAAAQ